MLHRSDTNPPKAPVQVEWAEDTQAAMLMGSLKPHLTKVKGIASFASLGLVTKFLQHLGPEQASFEP